MSFLKDLKSVIIIFLTLNSFACLKILLTFLFVESKFISKFFLSLLIIFKVLSPIEPVEPKIEIFFHYDKLPVNSIK